MKKVRGQIVYSPEERIQRMSLVDTETGCWNWTGTTRNGYGRITFGSRTDGTRKSVSAHRLSYETFNGPIPEGTEVCHKCDNPACVNPDHLFAGTRQENVADRENKGRNNPQKGERNSQAKLSEVDVISAKRLREKGETFKSIAQRFGVDKATVMKAIKSKTWRHIPAAPAMSQDSGKEKSAIRNDVWKYMIHGTF